MRRLVFELSGEHPTLPQSEIIGCIEAFGWPYTIIASYDQVLLVDTDEERFDTGTQAGDDPPYSRVHFSVRS